MGANGSASAGLRRFEQHLRNDESFDRLEPERRRAKTHSSARTADKRRLNIHTAEWEVMMIVGKDAAVGSAFKVPHFNTVNLGVFLSDDKVRDANPGFDGFERVFALVPQPDQSWKRVDLAYNPGYQGTGRDNHVASLQAGVNGWVTPSGELISVDYDQLRVQGVAFGMDTNVGTIWLQAPNQNTPLTF